MPTPAQLKAMKKLQDDRKGKKKSKKKPAPRTPEQKAKIKEFNDKYFKRNEPKEPGKKYRFGNSPSQRKRLSTTGSSDVAAKRKEREAKRQERMGNRADAKNERVAERKAKRTSDPKKKVVNTKSATRRTKPNPAKKKPTLKEKMSKGTKQVQSTKGIKQVGQERTANGRAKPKTKDKIVTSTFKQPPGASSK